MKLVDLKCTKCGKVHLDCLLVSGEDTVPEEGCPCGNMTSFIPILSPPRQTKHSSWTVK
jgi:hypothetical protein